MIQAIASFLTSAFDVSSATAEIIAVSILGLGIAALCGGFAYAIAKIGEGTGSFIDSLGQGLAAFLQGLGMLPAGIGEAAKSAGAGFGEMLKTPNTLVTKAAEVRIAQINAEKEVTDIQLTDGKGRSIGVKLSGTGANHSADRVLESLRGTSREVMGSTTVRVLTENRSQGSEE